MRVWKEDNSDKISVQPETLKEDEFIRWHQDELRENLNIIMEDCKNVQTFEYAMKQMEDYLELEFKLWRNDSFEDLKDFIDDELKI